MFIAHCLKRIKDGPQEPISFCSSEHAVSQVITFVSRWKQLVNDLNPDEPIELLLVSVSDVGTSITTNQLRNLGVVEITRDSLAEMKRMKQKNAKFNIEDFTVKYEEQQEEEIEVVTRGYNLPAMTELQSAKDIKFIHPIVEQLLLDGQLWLSVNELGKIEWVLEAGISSYKAFKSGKMAGPCFLVHRGKDFYLSATNPVEGN